MATQKPKSAACIAASEPQLWATKFEYVDEIAIQLVEKFDCLSASTASLESIRFKLRSAFEYRH